LLTENGSKTNLQWTHALVNSQRITYVTGTCARSRVEGTDMVWPCPASDATSHISVALIASDDWNGDLLKSIRENIG